MLKEYKEDRGKLSSFVPWICLIDKGIILNANGTLQKTLKYRGYDLDSSTEYELKNNIGRLNDVLKRFNGAWSINVEARRVKTNSYLETNSENYAVKVIDIERKENFIKTEYYESEYYITVIQLLQTDSSKKIGDAFLEYSSKREVLDRTLEDFKKDFLQILNLLKEIFLDVKELDDEETYTYLHSCVSVKSHIVKVPSVPYSISNYLCDCDLIGGLKPILGGKHLRVISIQGFPNFTTPGFFDNLNRLNIPYRWVTRFLMLSKIEALSKMEQKYKSVFSNRLSLVKRVMMQITGDDIEDPRKMNQDALEKADNIKTQIALTEGDYVSQGFYSCCIIVMGDTENDVEHKTEIIEKTINNLGFITIEESVNAVQAFTGSIPGNITENIRQPLLNSLTLSHLLPTSCVWGGDEYNKHLNTEPLIYTKTKGSTPFRFNLHIGDVGHTSIVGPTGYGKSTLLGLIAASFFKYKNSKIFFFDKGGSSRVLTYAVGGKFHDLGKDNLSFQPLKEIGIIEENIKNKFNELIKDKKISDVEKEDIYNIALSEEKIRATREREWAMEWILEILEQENLVVSPNQKEKIWVALENLSTTPVHLRTISNLFTNMNDREIQEALIPYKVTGAVGRYFDANNEGLKLSNWEAFEMDEVSKNKTAISPLLSMLFRRIENALDGSPSLIVLDECWMFFDNPKFSEKIREWLKVLRKKNCSVIFATQELGDIMNSKLFTTILDACQTKVFLPNPNAFSEEYIPIYKKFGLNNKEIEIISKGTPKKEYYYKSTKGSRKFELDLQPKTLKLIASSNPEEQNLAIKFYNDVAKDAEKFTKQWLGE